MALARKPVVGQTSQPMAPTWSIQVVPSDDDSSLVSSRVASTTPVATGVVALGLALPRSVRSSSRLVDESSLVARPGLEVLLLLPVRSSSRLVDESLSVVFPDGSGSGVVLVVSGSA